MFIFAALQLIDVTQKWSLLVKTFALARVNTARLLILSLKNTFFLCFWQEVGSYSTSVCEPASLTERLWCYQWDIWGETDCFCWITKWYLKKIQYTAKAPKAYWEKKTKKKRTNTSLIKPQLLSTVWLVVGLLTFAGPPVSDGSGHVSVKALLAVVAVAPGGVVAAVHADASALPPRQLVQLHVEATAAGVKVTVARCERRRRGEYGTNVKVYTVCALFI